MPPPVTEPLIERPLDVPDAPLMPHALLSTPDWPASCTPQLKANGGVGPSVLWCSLRYMNSSAQPPGSRTVQASGVVPFAWSARRTAMPWLSCDGGDCGGTTV